MMLVRPWWGLVLGVVLLAVLAGGVEARERDADPSARALADDPAREAPRAAAPNPDTAYVEPWGVAARSLLVPGWGHFRLGEDEWGTSYLVSALLGAGFGLEVVQVSSSENTRSFLRTMGWIQYGFSAVVSATMAFNAAEERNRENGWLLEARRGMDGRPVVAVTWRF